MTSDRAEIQIQAFLTARQLFCLRRQWGASKRPPHRVGVDEGGRRDALTVYVELALILFHLAGKLDLSPSPLICFLGMRKGGTDTPADSFPGERLQTSCPQSTQAPRATTASQHILRAEGGR